jgi:hypothetical protein
MRHVTHCILVGIEIYYSRLDGVTLVRLDWCETELLTVVTIKNTIMRHVTQCSLVGIEIYYSRLDGVTFCKTVFFKISFASRSITASCLVQKSSYDSVV